MTKLYKVKGSVKTITNLETCKEEYVALYTDSGLKTRFAIALKVHFETKPPDAIKVKIYIDRQEDK